MAAILRWFHADGVRHRAYMRYDESAGRRELVVATAQWQASGDATRDTLEQYTDEELISVARQLRATWN